LDIRFFRLMVKRPSESSDRQKAVKNRIGKKDTRHTPSKKDRQKTVSSDDTSDDTRVCENRIGKLDSCIFSGSGGRFVLMGLERS
jgi:hypothetical protein